MDDPFLDEILAEVKTEPEEIQEDQNFQSTEEEQISIIPFEPSEPPRFLTDNKQERVDSPTNTDYCRTQAQDIQRREANNQNSSFYANIPPKPTSITRSAHTSKQSPLTISAYNSLYGFQATTENVKQVAVNANPYSHIPLATQQAARRTGADTAQIISRDPRLQIRPAIDVLQKRATVMEGLKQRECVPTETLPVIPNIRGAPVPPPWIPPVIPKIITKDVETQTTKNDGTLMIFLSQDELMNLSSEKKEILIKFKQVKL
jgi:hypothetical protein